VAVEGVDEAPKVLAARAEWHVGRVSVSITLEGQEHQLWFAVSGEEPGREADFLVPLTLFPAMVTGSRLELPGEVSPRLLSAVPKIQDVFRLWGAEYWGGKFQDLQLISVVAEARGGPVNRAPGVACLFSGGVDSFYTLLKHREEVTHVIFVHGFDIALANEAVRAQASRMAREVAKELGKSLVEVEANISPFPRRVVGWDKYHGAALASVALLLQHRVRKVLIASSYTYAELIPWGSHPLLDPLWSTELTEIEHHGCEVTRIDKLAYLSEHEVAMQWLRVCLSNPNGEYNCGRCRKCTWARAGLRVVGALDRCKTLPHDLDLEEVASLVVSNEASRFFALQTLRALERRSTDPELTRTLAELLEKSPQTSEAMAERAQREDLQQELALAHKRLEQTRTRLEASRGIAHRLRTRVQRLQARDERLAEQNDLLTARSSGRRYRFGETLAAIALRTPVLGKLVRRKLTADNRWNPD
jgi:hypothetical protein